jgi:hypothetical protein
MSIEQRTLAVSNTPVTDSAFSYSDKNTAAGYHRISSGVHTVAYDYTDFVGTLKMQASLLLYPGDNDWVDIVGTEFGSADPVTDTFSTTFTGNFVWLRAAYNVQDGTVNSITYNF